jgi:glycosyltransferase involved in cell wall biosynthesis
MKISLITPVYSEERNIGPFLQRIIPVLKGCSDHFEIIFALDPSPDATESLILQACQEHAYVKMLKFSRRFGQPMATLAGLEHATGDAMVVMDVDLQDPPELIPQMLAKWREGYDVVYAQRTSRLGQRLIYRLITYLGYQMINGWRKTSISLKIPVISAS